MTERRQENQLGVIFDRLIGFMAGLAGVIIMCAMFSATFGVIMRHFFQRPIGWTAEFNAYALLYITYLSAAWVLSKEGHVIVNVATQYLKPKHAAALKAVTSVMGALVYLIITYFAVIVTWKNFINKYPVIATIRIPKYTILIIIPIGCFLLSVQFLRRARKAYILSKKQV